MNRDLVDGCRCIAPFLQFDKDPYLVITDQGHLAYVQDAYTTSSYFPNAQAVDPSTLPAGSGLSGASFDYVRNSVKIVMDAYDGTTNLYVVGPVGPDHPGLGGRSSPACSSRRAPCRPWLRRTCGLPGGPVRRRRRGCTRRYHVTDPADVLLPGQRPLDGPPAADEQPAGLPSRRTTSRCDMPGASAAEYLLLQPMVPPRPPEHDRLDRGRNDGDDYGKVDGGAVPARHVDLRARTQIEAPHRPGSHHQRADHPLEPVRVHGGAGQPHRRARSAVAAVPRADLPPVHQHPVPRVPADRRRVADEGRLGRDADGGPERAAGHLVDDPTGRQPAAVRVSVAPGPPPPPRPGRRPPSGPARVCRRGTSRR